MSFPAVIARRPFGSMHRTVRFHSAQGSAELGRDDDGLRVVHSRVETAAGIDYRETPTCGVRLK